MAKELSITQDFSKLTLTLPADMVTISVEVKSLKGHYTYSQNNNYTDLSFKLWSEDFQPSGTFMRIVREMQIEPNGYYLETIVNQTLCDNFAMNCHRPKVTVVEQKVPQDDDTNRQIQCPCPSNWSDYLYVADDKYGLNRTTYWTTYHVNWYKSTSRHMCWCKYNSTITLNRSPGIDNSKTKR